MIYFMYAMNIVFILIKYSHYISFILAVIYIFLKLIKHPEMNCNRVISFVIFQAVVYLFCFVGILDVTRFESFFAIPLSKGYSFQYFPSQNPFNYKQTINLPPLLGKPQRMSFEKW